MTEREALLRAVCENPDDDTPRLVFADWLDENGDPQLAEYIRCEIELDKLLAGGMPSIDWFRANPEERLPRLMRRRTELRAAGYKQWMTGLPRVKDLEWKWPDNRRGFADTVEVQTDAVLIANEAIFLAVPIQQVTIWSIRGYKALSKFAPLARVRRLNAYGIPDRAAFKLFTECPLLDGIRELHFDGPSISADTMSAIRRRFGNRLKDSHIGT